MTHVDEARLQVAVARFRATGTRDWTASAPCSRAGVDADAYFPDEGPPSAYAIALCRTCPVAAECLATALVGEAEDDLRYGWWGGVGPTERDIVAERIGLSKNRVRRDDLQVAELARELRAQSRTVRSIATELGCTERTVYRYLHRAA